MLMAWKRPLESVVVWRETSPLAASLIVTVASGMTEPEISVTVPLTGCDCAMTGRLESAKRKNGSRAAGSGARRRKLRNIKSTETPFCGWLEAVGGREAKTLTPCETHRITA